MVAVTVFFGAVSEASDSPISAVYLVLVATIVSGLGMIGLRETAH
jgi:hypothetical protein